MIRLFSSSQYAAPISYSFHDSVTGAAPGRWTDSVEKAYDAFLTEAEEKSWEHSTFASPHKVTFIAEALTLLQFKEDYPELFI